MMRLADINDAVNGKLVGADVSLKGITTDSRRDCSNRLFVA